MLRVPDFPDRPVERADALETALIIDAEADADAVDIARRASTLVRAVLEGSSRATTRIHVFAGFRWQEALRGLGNDPRVVIYDPECAPTYADSVKDRLERGQPPLRVQAWADWILSGVGSRTLDAVHMMTRARWTETGAYFPITVSPSPREAQSLLTTIDLGEFGTMTTRIGAWAVTFTPPSSDVQLDVAFIADRFAHFRPGAVLFDAGETAENAADLRAACRLLFSARSLPAPQLRGGFLSCHPAFVRGEAERTLGDLLPELAIQAGVLAARAPLAQRLFRDVTRLLPGVATKELTGPPSWIAALQRLLEEAGLEAARRSGSDVLLTNLHPGSSDPAHNVPALTERAAVPLALLQDVLKKLGRN